MPGAEREPAQETAGRSAAWPWRMAYAAYLGLVVIAALCAVPIVAVKSFRWEEMNWPLLGGTVALALASFCKISVDFSARSAAGYLGLAFGISWAAEHMGMRWGVPFAYRYSYHDALVPVLPGGVPLLIPLAWFVLATLPLILLRDVSIVRQSGRTCPGRLALKVVLCALCLVAFDLMLDPLAISVETWTWEQRGAYFGTPYLNFLGWFVVGLAVYTPYFSLDRLLGRRRAVPPAVFDATMAAGTLLLVALAGVAAVHRLRSIAPVLLSLAVIGPYWAYWLVSRRRNGLAAIDPGRMRR